MVILADIQSLLERQWQVEITHILRESNYCADAMAKRGANQSDALRNWHLPPSELHDLLVLAAGAAIVVFIRV